MHFISLQRRSVRYYLIHPVAAAADDDDRNAMCVRRQRRAWFGARLREIRGEKTAQLHAARADNGGGSRWKEEGRKAKHNQSCQRERL